MRIPWAFVLAAEAPDSSGAMRLAAKAGRVEEWNPYCTIKHPCAHSHANISHAELHFRIIDESSMFKKLTEGQEKFVHHFCSRWMGNSASDAAIKLF